MPQIYHSLCISAVFQVFLWLAQLICLQSLSAPVLWDQFICLDSSYLTCCLQLLFNVFFIAASWAVTYKQLFCFCFNAFVTYGTCDSQVPYMSYMLVSQVVSLPCHYQSEQLLWENQLSKDKNIQGCSHVWDWGCLSILFLFFSVLKYIPHIP